MKIEEWTVSATPRFMQDVAHMQISEGHLDIWERNLSQDPMIGDRLFEEMASELRIYGVAGHSIIYHASFDKQKVQLHRLIPHEGRALLDKIRAAASAGDKGAKFVERLLGALSKL